MKTNQTLWTFKALINRNLRNTLEKTMVLKTSSFSLLSQYSDNFICQDVHLWRYLFCYNVTWITFLHGIIF